MTNPQQNFLHIVEEDPDPEYVKEKAGRLSMKQKHLLYMLAFGENEDQTVREMDSDVGKLSWEGLIRVMGWTNPDEENSMLFILSSVIVTKLGRAVAMYLSLGGE